MNEVIIENCQLRTQIASPRPSDPDPTHVFLWLMLYRSSSLSPLSWSRTAGRESSRGRGQLFGVLSGGGRDYVNVALLDVTDFFQPMPGGGGSMLLSVAVALSVFSEQCHQATQSSKAGKPSCTIHADVALP
jgi:hypothetical protein